MKRLFRFTEPRGALPGERIIVVEGCDQCDTYVGDKYTVESFETWGAITTTCGRELVTGEYEVIPEIKRPPVIGRLSGGHSL